MIVEPDQRRTILAGDHIGNEYNIQSMWVGPISDRFRELIPYDALLILKIRRSIEHSTQQESTYRIA